MKIANKKKITNFLNFNLKLIVLSSLIFSQLSLSEIFLYQNNSNSPSVNIAKANTSDTWYNSAWSYRKQITLNSAKVPSTQTNFPVLISLTDDSLKTAPTGEVHDSNGYDIIFTDQSGNKLDHEIESYNGNTGTINMWVRIPTLSHDADTLIYIYYGNSAISATQEAIMGVWDINTKMVQHMNQNPSGAPAQMLDSTQYSNDGTSAGTMTSGDLIVGQIGGSVDFDGTDDSVNMGNDESLDFMSAMTIESWVKPNNRDFVDTYAGIINTIVGNGDNSATYINYELQITNPTRISFLKRNPSEGLIWYNFDTTNNMLDSWQHLVVTYDGSSIDIILNGVNLGAQVVVGGIDPQNNTGLKIGRFNSELQTKFSGSIDEVRISNTARSADWITTEYNNQSDPDTFLSLSSEEESTPYLTVTGATTQTAGTNQTVTITAKDSMGNTDTLYTGDRTITLSEATTIDGHTPTFTDKNTAEVNFDSSGTILFTNGVATTDIQLYKAETAEIDVTDGTYSTTGNASYDLNVTVSPAAVNSFDISSPSTITSETPFSLTLTSKDSSGNTTTGVTNSTALSINQGTINISSIPNTDFTTNGIYTNNITISNITQNNNIVLTITNGSISNTQNLSVIGVSHGVGLFPQKPVIDSTAVAIGNLSDLPDNITQIAISRTPDFTDISWQDFDKDKFSHLNENQETLYFKFRTNQGAVSDVVVYTPQPRSETITSTLNDGDIVKTISSPDVYVIKIKNNKKFKRLILSPKVFQSYGHLKWENLKTISQEELNQYTTSDLVKETLDTIIYHLFPSGDMGERKALNADEAYDIDSVYEVNKVDRDSYNLVK